VVGLWTVGLGTVGLWTVTLAASEESATHALVATTNSVPSKKFLEVLMALPFKARANPDVGSVRSLIRRSLSAPQPRTWFSA
jgi:hypothetical protein